MWETHSFWPAHKAVHSDGCLMKTVLFCCSDCVFSHLLLSHILGEVSPSYLLSSLPLSPFQGEMDWKAAGVRVSVHLAHVQVLLGKSLGDP